MTLFEKVSDKFIELTLNNPGFLHFDSMGFFRLSTEKNSMLETLNSLFLLIEQRGGNILLPTYSYSFTKNEVYSIGNSPSDLGRVSEYLREKNPSRRTSDANFSYICFGNNFLEDYFKPRDWNTFGAYSSLIADMFNKDGYLLSVGDKLHFSTEVHYLEKMLNVQYRFDKIFSGKIEALDGTLHEQNMKYFCRDVEFSNKYNSIVSFEKLFTDMKKNQLIQEFVIEDTIKIDSVKLQVVYAFVKDKLKEDAFYLMKDKTTSGPVSI